MIGKISQQLVNDLQGVFESFSSSGPGANKDELRLAVEALLAKLNVVTREEFDAQTAVLHRTRERLAALEAQVQALEERLDNGNLK